MMQEEQNFEILDGFPADVVAVSAHGRITRADYEGVLMPHFEQAVLSEGKVKLLFVFGMDFTGYSAGAAWDDAKFGLLHLREIAGLAVVTDLEWLRLGAKAFAPFIACPVAVFHNNEMAEARTWITEWKHDREGGPEVAAEHKLPTLEDKI